MPGRGFSTSRETGSSGRCVRRWTSIRSVCGTCCPRSWSCGLQVSRKKIVATVLAQHVVQSMLGLMLLDEPVDMSTRTFGGEAIRFIGAMFVLDAWQFAFHRLFHEVDWLYRHIHVWHHTMYIPHAYGALYQHPIEMVIMDTLSGMVAVNATGMPAPLRM